VLAVEEEAAIQIWAVRSDGVDLAGSIRPLSETFASAPRRVAAYPHDVAVEARVLALRTEKSGAEREDQVVAAALGNGSIDVEAMTNGIASDREFGDGPLSGRSSA
jgi:hypothetical protein